MKASPLRIRGLPRLRQRQCLNPGGRNFNIVPVADDLVEHLGSVSRSIPAIETGAGFGIANSTASLFLTAEYAGASVCQCYIGDTCKGCGVIRDVKIANKKIRGRNYSVITGNPAFCLAHINILNDIIVI